MFVIIFLSMRIVGSRGGFIVYSAYGFHRLVRHIIKHPKKNPGQFFYIDMEPDQQSVRPPAGQGGDTGGRADGWVFGLHFIHYIDCHGLRNRTLVVVDAQDAVNIFKCDRALVNHQTAAESEAAQ